MGNLERFELKDPGEGRAKPWGPQPAEPQPRAVGSPLPVGSGSPSALPGPQVNSLPAGNVPPAAGAPGPALGRGLNNSQALVHMEPIEVPTGLQKTINAIRAALPFIQRILPLLDGNVGTAVSNLMAPHPHKAPPPAPPVDLAPLEEGLNQLQTQHRELRTQAVEQNTSLKRVEDQLEMVREATDRNTLEQQELLEDLKSVGNKVNIFAMIAILLLVASIMMNVILYLHIKRVLP